MGHTFVEAEVGNLPKTKIKRIRLLADSGASFMTLSPNLSAELGIEPVTKIDVTLADGRKINADLGFAYVKIADRETISQTLIIDSPEPLLGSFTLQMLGLLIDPVKEEVRPSRNFATGLLTL